MRLHWVLAATVGLVLAGCANAIDSDSARSALDARQRDSLISTSALPGAATLGRALDQADAASARAAAIDSLAR